MREWTCGWLFTLSHLFAGRAAPPWAAAADFGGSGAVKLEDAAGTLSYLFTIGSAPAPPVPCGVDPTPDALICVDDSC